MITRSTFAPCPVDHVSPLLSPLRLLCRLRRRSPLRRRIPSRLRILPLHAVTYGRSTHARARGRGTTAISRMLGRTASSPAANAQRRRALHRPPSSASTSGRTPLARSRRSGGTATTLSCQPWRIASALASAATRRIQIGARRRRSRAPKRTSGRSAS